MKIKANKKKQEMNHTFLFFLLLISKFAKKVFLKS